MNSSLNIHLKPDVVFKKQRTSKVQIHLHDKVIRLLDNLEQYEMISPIIKEKKQKKQLY